MKKYAIFSVSDYKGGELDSSINLNKSRLIAKLADLFENVEFDDFKKEKRDNKIKKVLDEPTSDFVKEKLIKALGDEDFFSTYAGGDGFCGEIYEIDGNRMREVTIDSFIDDIVIVVTKKWSR